MSLATDGSPYRVLLPTSKIIKYSKLPDCSGRSEAGVGSIFAFDKWRDCFWIDGRKRQDTLRDQKICGQKICVQNVWKHIVDLSGMLLTSEEIRISTPDCCFSRTAVPIPRRRIWMTAAEISDRFLSGVNFAYSSLFRHSTTRQAASVSVTEWESVQGFNSHKYLSLK